jgi:hypothetical protein
LPSLFLFSSVQRPLGTSLALLSQPANQNQSVIILMKLPKIDSTIWSYCVAIDYFW